MRHPVVDASIKTLVRAAHGCLCPVLRSLSRLETGRIIIYYAYPDFGRKSEALADLLRRRGLSADVCSGTSVFRRAQAKSSAHLWIGFWNEYPLDSFPKNYIFFNAEPLNLDRWKLNEGWKAGIRNAVEVWDYNRRNAEALAALGARFRHVPFGYAPYYEASFRQSTQGKALTQDIDVLFVGTISDRRRRVLERIQALGIRVYAATRANPAYGVALDELLARSKIFLGIHANWEPQAQIPDLARLDHPIANRIFVLHERPAGRVEHPGFEENVATCEYEDIPNTCAELLSRPDERRRRAEAAHLWFRSEYALEAFIPYRDLQEHIQRLSGGKGEPREPTGHKASGRGSAPPTRFRDEK